MTIRLFVSKKVFSNLYIEWQSLFHPKVYLWGICTTSWRLLVEERKTKFDLEIDSNGHARWWNGHSLYFSSKPSKGQFWVPTKSNQILDWLSKTHVAVLNVVVWIASLEEFTLIAQTFQKLWIDRGGVNFAWCWLDLTSFLHRLEDNKNAQSTQSRWKCACILGPIWLKYKAIKTKELESNGAPQLIRRSWVKPFALLNVLRN